MKKREGMVEEDEAAGEEKKVEERGRERGGRRWRKAGEVRDGGSGRRS